MSEASTPVDPAPDEQLLRNVRLALAITPVLLAAPFVTLVVTDQLSAVAGTLLALPLLLPYVAVLIRSFWPVPESMRDAAGLGLAGLVIGGLLLVLIAALVLSRWSRAGWQAFAILGAYLAVTWIHWTLFRNASRIHDQLWPGLSRWKRWGKPAVVVGVYLVWMVALLGTAIPGLLRSGGHEATQLAMVRTISTAAVVYHSTYNGFPPTLVAMGPPRPGEKANCQAADLIDPTLASGRKAGYVYTYLPGPPAEKQAPECPAAKSYTLSARPQVYGTTGTRSFFADETGIIRWTTEDRAATAQDPTIN